MVNTPTKCAHPPRSVSFEGQMAQNVTKISDNRLGLVWRRVIDMCPTGRTAGANAAGKARKLSGNLLESADLASATPGRSGVAPIVHNTGGVSVEPIALKQRLMCADAVAICVGVCLGVPRAGNAASGTAPRLVDARPAAGRQRSGVDHRDGDEQAVHGPRQRAADRGVPPHLRRDGCWRGQRHRESPSHRSTRSSPVCG